MPKWYLDATNSEYRTIRAKDPIKKHEKIFEAEALSLTVHDSQRAKYCNFCLKESENLMKCSQCSIFYYCSENCQKQDWLASHKYECEFFKKTSSKNLPNELILVLRLYDFYKENENFRQTLSKMKSHEKSYSEQTLQEMKETASRIIEILKEEHSKVPLVLEIMLKVKINFFTIEIPSYITNLAIGTGFYQGESNFFNHSCSPNAVKIFIGRKMEIFACEDIEPQQEIFICYDELMGKPFNLRQTYLKENYNMECCCRLCVKEKSNLNNLYSNIGLKCQRCKDKGTIINNVCSKCSHKHDNSELAEIHKTIEEKIEKFVKNNELKFEEMIAFSEDLKKNSLDSSSYLMEIVISHIIHGYHEKHFSSHTNELYEILKFYVRNYDKWFDIDIPSLGFKYNELSKLALTLKKGKKAKKYCDLAWKFLSHYFLESTEMAELKKRMTTVELLLQAGNEMKNNTVGALKID